MSDSSSRSPSGPASTGDADAVAAAASHLLDDWEDLLGPSPLAAPPPPPFATAASSDAGFCHSCSRQVQVNVASFTCVVCGGGFVEFGAGGGGGGASERLQPGRLLSPPATSAPAQATAASTRPPVQPRDLLSSLFDDDFSWLSNLSPFSSAAARASSSSLSSSSSRAPAQPPASSFQAAATPGAFSHHFLGAFESGVRFPLLSERFAAASTSPTGQSSTAATSAESASARLSDSDAEPEAILIAPLPRFVRPARLPVLDPAQTMPSTTRVSASDVDQALSTLIAPPSTASSSNSGRSSNLYRAGGGGGVSSDARRQRYLSLRNMSRYPLRSHTGASDRPRTQTATAAASRRPETAAELGGGGEAAFAGLNDLETERRRFHHRRPSISRLIARAGVPMDLDSSNDEAETPPLPSRRSDEPGVASSASSSSRRSRSPPIRFQFRGAEAGIHVNFLDDDDGFLNEHGAIIITTLLNQLRNNHRGPAPASDTQLESLPLVDIDQPTFDKNIQCAVCMDDFQLNDKAKQLPCKHLFHDPCIVPWLKLHATCPVCRKNIGGDSPTTEEPATNRFEIFRPYNFMARRQTSNTSSTSSTSTTATAGSTASSSSSSSASSSSSTSSAAAGASSFFGRQGSRDSAASASFTSLFPTSSGLESRLAASGPFSSFFESSSRAAATTSLAADSAPHPPSTAATAPRFTLNPRLFRIHISEGRPMRQQPMSSVAGAAEGRLGLGAGAQLTHHHHIFPAPGVAGSSADRFVVRLNLADATSPPRSVSLAAPASSSSSSSSAAPEPFVFGASDLPASGRSFLASSSHLTAPRPIQESLSRSPPAYNTRAFASQSSRTGAHSSSASSAGPSRVSIRNSSRISPYDFRDRLRTLTTRHQTEMRRRAQASFRGTVEPTAAAAAAAVDESTSSSSGLGLGMGNLRTRTLQSLGPLISSISLRIGVRPTNIVTNTPPRRASRNAEEAAAASAAIESVSPSSSSSSAASSQSTATLKEPKRRLSRESEPDIIELDSDEVASSSVNTSSNTSSMTLRSQAANNSASSSSLVITISDDDDEDEQDEAIQPRTSASAGSGEAKSRKRPRGNSRDLSSNNNNLRPTTSRSMGDDSQRTVLTRRASKASAPLECRAIMSEEATAKRTRSALRTSRDEVNKSRRTLVKKEPKDAAKSEAVKKSASLLVCQNEESTNSSIESAGLSGLSSSTNGVIYEEDIVISEDSEEATSDAASGSNGSNAITDDLLSSLIQLDDEGVHLSSSSDDHDDDEDEDEEVEDEEASGPFEITTSSDAVELDDIFEDLDALASFSRSRSSSTRRPLLEPSRKRQRMETPRSNDSI